jgi:hypothetical protein
LGTLHPPAHGPSPSTRAKWYPLKNGFLSSNSVIKDHGGVELHTLVLCSPFESKSLQIDFAVCLTGTHNKGIILARTDMSQIPGAPPDLSMPKHEYELMFIDINGRLFDQTALLRSKKLMNFGGRWRILFDR